MRTLSPHSPRHSAITFALDGGATLRDVQDYADHKDPSPPAATTTPATAWTSNAAYAVAAHLA